LSSADWNCAGSTSAGHKRPSVDDDAELLDERVEVDDLRAQRLLAREGEELLGQPPAALRRALRRVDQAMQALIVADAGGDEVEIAGDRRQQVVEVMRDAAGELADRLHLLRLLQRHLRALQRLHLGGEPPVGVFERAGALEHALLERLVEPPERLFGALALGDVAHHAGEVALAPGAPFGDRQLEREERTVAALALHLAEDADGLGLSGPAIALDVAVMRRAVGLRHQHLDVPPDHRRGGIAEDLLGGEVEGLHDARLVDDRDRVDRGVDDGVVFGLVAGQLDARRRLLGQEPGAIARGLLFR
jgi:hypothetical protein